MRKPVAMVAAAMPRRRTIFGGEPVEVESRHLGRRIHYQSAGWPATQRKQPGQVASRFLEVYLHGRVRIR